MQGLQETDYRPLEQSLSVSAFACAYVHAHLFADVKMGKYVFKPEVINYSPRTACAHLQILPHHLSLVTICGHFCNLSVVWLWKIKIFSFVVKTVV